MVPEVSVVEKNAVCSFWKDPKEELQHRTTGLCSKVIDAIEAWKYMPGRASGPW